MRSIVLPALLLLAACGSKPAAERKAETVEPGTELPADTASKDVDQYLAEQRSAEAMTSIDAATGDAAGMPGDYHGPTAGEIAERQRDKARAEQTAMAHALDQALAVDTDLPDPVTGAEPAGGETSVVETD